MVYEIRPEKAFVKRIDKKQRIRMVTITNHEELVSGKLQN